MTMVLVRRYQGDWMPRVIIFLESSFESIILVMKRSIQRLGLGEYDVEEFLKFWWHCIRS